MDIAFRQLSVREKELIEKLLEHEFPGRDELLSQLPFVTAKIINEEDGTLKLQCSSGSPAPRKNTLAVEGACPDADGEMISVLLHVDKSGFMHMLEIIKYAPSPIIKPPAASDLLV